MYGHVFETGLDTGGTKIAMSVDVDDRERFRGARLCYGRVLSHGRPNTYIVYSSKGRAHCSEGPQLFPSLLSVLYPSRTSLILAYVVYGGHLFYQQ